MLLDTHVVIWLLTDDPALGPRARSALHAATDRLVSAASVWEVAIKAELHKIVVSDDFPDQVTAAGLTWLEVSADHAWAVRSASGLPHRDPFDRMLIAQAQVAGVPLLTADELILNADLSPAVDRIDARR